VAYKRETERKREKGGRTWNRKENVKITERGKNWEVIELMEIKLNDRTEDGKTEGGWGIGNLKIKR
jgi:hypothetical protein